MVSVRFDRLTPPTVVKGPIPTLQVKNLPRVSTEGLSETQGGDPGPLLISLHPSANILGVPVDSVVFGGGVALGQPLAFFGQREAQWNIRMPRFLVDAIESVRVNDVNVVLSVEFLIWLPHTSENRLPFQWTNAQWIEEIPQSRWLPILDDLGYSGGWIIELAKPRILGMETVQKYLTEADKNLQVRNPKGALLACRQAWKTLDSVIEPIDIDLDKVIDGLSRTEIGKESKSKRVENIRVAVENLTQIGPHEEVYEVTLDDALLAYQLTVVLAAYIGKKSRDAEELRAARTPQA